MAAALSASAVAAFLLGSYVAAALLAGVGAACALFAALYAQASIDQSPSERPPLYQGPLPSFLTEAIAPPPPPPVDFSPLDDARRRLLFAQAIAARVPSFTEEAAFSLIERFESMRGNSSKAASAAREIKNSLSGGGSHAPVAEQAEKTRKAIRSQNDSVAEMASHNRQGAKDLRAMGKELEGGLDLLKGIEEINDRSRLIAFNMAVEAARIGDKGRGFRVIVGELRKLNDQTADFSHQVVELLGRFREYNANLVGKLAEESERVSGQVQEGMDAAEGAVEALIEASNSADKFARQIAGLAEGFDSDLDGVLESLQFQDITRQMIEGSIAVLVEVRSDLEDIAARVGTSEDVWKDGRRLEDLRRMLLARSKTKGEKDAIMEVNHEISRGG